MTSMTSGFLSYFKISKESKPTEVDRLVHGRQLAMLNNLPNWEGFVTSKNAAKMTPLAALIQLQQVCYTTMKAQVTIRGAARHNWNPPGFNGESVGTKSVFWIKCHLHNMTEASSANIRLIMKNEICCFVCLKLCCK